MSEPELNQLNAEIVILLQELGIAAPSTTTLQGRLAIRVALTNHRTQREDLDLLAAEVCRLGDLGCRAVVKDEEIRRSA